MMSGYCYRFSIAACLFFFSKAALGNGVENISSHTVSDYGTAFGLLHNLGYPNTEGYSLVRLNAGTETYSPLWAYQNTKIGRFPLANGLLKENGTHSPALFVDLLGREVEIVSEASEPSTKSSVGFRSAGKWASLDMKAYADAYIHMLGQERLSLSENLFGEVYSLEEASYSVGTLFLGASLYDNGFTNEANTMVHFLMQNSNDPDKIISLAINSLANHCYRRALEQVCENGDWIAFSNVLNDMLDKYGSVWDGYDQVEQLASMAKDNPEKSLILEDESSCPTQLVDRIKQLIFITPTNFPSFGVLDGYPWILVESGGEISSSNQIENAFIQLFEGGMESVRLLLEVKTNTILLQVEKEKIERDDHLGLYHDSDDVSAISPPLTLGELADALLRLLMPGGSYGRLNSYDAQNRLDPSEWYETHKSMTREELAFDYLEKGSHRQKKVAFAILSKNVDADTCQKIERIILDEQSEFESAVWLTTVYAELVGRRNATNVIDTLITKIESEYFPETKSTEAHEDLLFINDQDVGSYEVENAKRLVSRLKKLVGDAGGELDAKEFSDLLNAILNPVSDQQNSAWQSLGMALITIPLSETIPLLNKAVLSATHSPTCSQLLLIYEYLPQIESESQNSVTVDDSIPPWRTGISKRDMERQETSRLPVELSLSSMHSFWKKMLNAPPDIQKNVAMIMERWYGDASSQRTLNRIRNLLGKRLDSTMIERAKARLNNKTLPELPSEQAAFALDHRAIASNLVSTAVTELPSALKNLELNEILALSYNLKTNQLLSAHLANAAVLIKLKPENLVVNDTSLTTNLVQLLVDHMTVQTGTNSVLMRIQVESLLQGVSITQSNIKPAKYSLERWLRSEENSPPAGPLSNLLAIDLISGGRGAGSIAWPITVSEIEESDATEHASEDLLDEELQSQGNRNRRYQRGSELNRSNMWAVVESICSPTNNPLRAAQVDIWYVPAEYWQEIGIDDEKETFYD